MAEPIFRRRWGYAALFAGIAAVILFVRLLPLGLPAELPGPDILLALTFAWIMRRPDYLPVALVAAIALIEDFLLGRPPGLWAAMVVLGTEFLRARQPLLREIGLALEWALVAGVLLAMVFVSRLVMVLVAAPQPSLGLSLLQVLLTILVYPLAAALSYVAFGLRRPATGEVDALGRPL